MKQNKRKKEKTQRDAEKQRHSQPHQMLNRLLSFEPFLLFACLSEAEICQVFVKHNNTANVGGNNNNNNLKYEWL